MNIFLIGFMGSGKSLLGKPLAKVLHKHFIDFDAYIEEKEQQTISQIFESRGEGHYREIEHQLLLDLHPENAVIALGGGTPCFYNNIDIIKAKGTVVYLKQTPEILQKRLLTLDPRPVTHDPRPKKNSRTTRPLIQHLSEPELLNFIKKKLSEREPIYAQAHYTIESSEDALENIAKIFK